MKFVGVAFLWILVLCEAVTPIQKVLELLKSMSVKGSQEKQEEAVVFARFEQFYESSTADKKEAIITFEDSISTLTANIAEAEQNSADATVKIGETLRDLAMNDAEIRNATDIREQEHHEYEVLLQDYTESVQALKSAIEILKNQPGTVAQSSVFAQLAGLKLISSKAKQTLDAFLQQARDPLDSDAFAYEFHSQSVVDVLQQLLEKFVEEKNQLETTEVSAQHTYFQNQADLKATNEQLEGAKELQVTRKAENERVAQAKSEVKKQTEVMLADDTAYLNELTAVYNQKHSEFVARQKLREEELEAIEKAVEILTNEVQPHDEKWVHQNHSALVQMRGVRADPSLERVSSFLIAEAQRLHSPLLSTLATKAETDPFVKVRDMISNLITHLMEEAASEAGHKGWCDTELATNAQSREEKATSIEKLHATVDQLEASIEKLTMEIAELSTQVTELQTEVGNATSLRNEEKTSNEAAVKDVQAAQASLAQAIQILTMFYSQAGQAVASQPSSVQGAPSTWTDAYHGNQASGNSVIGFLQVIQSDFARLEAETTSAESEAAQSFTALTRDAEVAKATKTKEIEHKTEERQAQQVSLVETNSSLADTKQALVAANNYYETLKPTCVNVGMTPEEKKAQREEEITSLREALEILESHSS